MQPFSLRWRRGQEECLSKTFRVNHPKDLLDMCPPPLFLVRTQMHARASPQHGRTFRSRVAPGDSTSRMCVSIVADDIADGDLTPAGSSRGRNRILEEESGDSARWSGMSSSAGTTNSPLFFVGESPISLDRVRGGGGVWSGLCPSC